MVSHGICRFQGVPMSFYEALWSYAYSGRFYGTPLEFISPMHPCRLVNRCSRVRQDALLAFVHNVAGSVIEQFLHSALIYTRDPHFHVRFCVGFQTLIPAFYDNGRYLTVPAASNSVLHDNVIEVEWSDGVTREHALVRQSCISTAVRHKTVSSDVSLSLTALPLRVHFFLDIFVGLHFSSQSSLLWTCVRIWNHLSSVGRSDLFPVPCSLQAIPSSSQHAYVRVL